MISWRNLWLTLTLKWSRYSSWFFWRVGEAIVKYVNMSLQHLKKNLCYFLYPEDNFLHWLCERSPWHDKFICCLWYWLVWLDLGKNLPKLERMEYKIPSPYRWQNIWYVVFDILKNWHSGIIFVLYFAM